jgi:hypothetical protein
LGAAYVFRRDGTEWTEEAKILAPGGNSHDYFGNSVSVSGDYAVAGADGDEVNGFSSGAAFIFRRVETSWVVDASLIPVDGAAGDHFGYSLSILGDYCVVGAYGDDDDGGLTRGSAYMYVREATGWTLQAKLLPNDEGGLFGFSVSLSPDYCIIGAYGSEDHGNASGAAYVFRRDGNIWTQEAKLLASDGHFEDVLGWSVSISGDYAIVGAPQHIYGSGAAYIYKREGTTWTEEQKLTAFDGALGHSFGNAVSMSGDYCIVGAPEDGPGSAYLFRRDGSNWAFVTKLTASDAGELDYFGRRVCISGDEAVVGEMWDDQNGYNSGAVYLYSGFIVQSPISITVSVSPSSGNGSFDYEADLTNQTDSSQTVDIWTEMTGPDGRRKIGSIADDKTLDPGRSYSTSGSHSLGEGAPPGDYFFTTNAGEYPGLVISSGTASYTKKSTEKRESPRADQGPAVFHLSQNHPNPFNPSTTISYELAVKTHVRLELFNPLGQRVAILVDGEKAAGYHSVTLDGRGLASGLYFYRLQAGELSNIKKLVVVK